MISADTLDNLQVNNLVLFESNMKHIFANKVQSFRGGQLTHFLGKWKELTFDSEVLNCVRGQYIEFSTQPTKNLVSKRKTLNISDSLVIEAEIKKLLDKGVIVPTQHESGEYISPIFVTNKKDGSSRMILNLKSFNQHVEYQHFKMDSVWTAIRLMTPNCYMASIDLKDAYYSVPIAKPHQKYLKFEWNNMLFQFTCFPNGLAFCPRKFTKLMKPVFATLRQLGHLLSGYIDDSWLMGTVWDDCAKNVVDTVKLLDSLGFVVHPEKSVFIPTQKLVFLGFTLDSVNMQVYLTPDKAVKLKQAATVMLHCKKPTIRDVAKVLGLIVSCFPGVAYGPLHYRYLERDKTIALNASKWNFDATMCISSQAGEELKWWIESIETASNPINRGEVDITITSDASKQGWGAATSDSSTGGLWTVEEAKEHINFLEMLAVFFALKSFSTLTHGKHVKVMVDNTTTESTINQMGTSHSPKLNKLTKDIWDWCIKHDIWLTMARIPGCENVKADKESRTFRRCTEWCLKKTLFARACTKLNVTPNIDLFASRINCQITPYVSYRADPEAFAINAFHMSWQHYLFYAFPPFSLITRVLQKIQEEKATGLLLVPKWPTQPWWPKLMQMLIQPPVQLPKDRDTLFLPSSPQEPHPLHKKLCLILCHLSGDTSTAKAFRQQLPQSWNTPGGQALESNMLLTLRNGDATVVQGALIPFVPL